MKINDIQIPRGTPVRFVTHGCTGSPVPRTGILRAALRAGNRGRVPVAVRVGERVRVFHPFARNIEAATEAGGCA